MIYLPLAIELAHERAREFDRLAGAAGHVAMHGKPIGPRRPSRVRILAARPLHLLGAAGRVLSSAALLAASRIEGTAQ